MAIERDWIPVRLVWYESSHACVRKCDMIATCRSVGPFGECNFIDSIPQSDLDLLCLFHHLHHQHNSNIGPLIRDTQIDKLSSSAFLNISMCRCVSTVHATFNIVSSFWEVKMRNLFDTKTVRCLMKTPTTTTTTSSSSSSSSVCVCFDCFFPCDELPSLSFRTLYRLTPATAIHIYNVVVTLNDNQRQSIVP